MDLDAAWQGGRALWTRRSFARAESAPATCTTPPAPSLAHWMAHMAAGGCSHLVMEVSSRALSQARVAGIEFDTVCVTNVRSDHLDYHGSLANYRRAKA